MPNPTDRHPVGHRCRVGRDATLYYTATAPPPRPARRPPRTCTRTVNHSVFVQRAEKRTPCELYSRATALQCKGCAQFMRRSSKDASSRTLRPAAPRRACSDATNRDPEHTNTLIKYTHAARMHAAAASTAQRRRRKIPQTLCMYITPASEYRLQRKAISISHFGFLWRA